MIIDMHTHIFPPEIKTERQRYCERDSWLSELYGNPKAKMATADELIASMDAAGIDVSVTFPFGWRDPDLAEVCNSYMLTTMHEYPGRIIGLACIQPLDVAHAIREIERCSAGGMPGIGELMPHGQGYRLDDLSLLSPILAHAEELGLFILTHVSEPVGHLYPGKGNVAPGHLYRILQSFPKLKVVAAHWGGGFPFYELMPEVQAAATRLWYDSAASQFLYRAAIFPIGAQLVGVEKILFGSDYPLIGQQRCLDHIRSSGLTKEQLELVLGGNAQQLLGIK